MAIGEGAVAEILQNAASAVNTVKFEMTAAQEFVAKQNWPVGLEGYLSEFLTKVQGDKFYHHPGLFRSLYQAHISSLIGAKQFDEAQDLFDDKVSPLVAHREDLYAPLDLEYRVQVLEDCVWKWALYDLDKSQSAAKPEAREILVGQEKQIGELRKALILSDPPDSSLAYMSVQALRNLSDDLLPLLKYMPAYVSELLLEQDKKITELRRSLMLAAAGRHRPTAPDDHGTSSTDSC
ncbi:unnamed protein product [Urochloa decumbens]|uniref:Uncharacterized protein n=1 Tax=Urochloa decumbens TaxID=240449 RepID=A0ABC9D9W5_9POAL